MLADLKQPEYLKIHKHFLQITGVHDIQVSLMPLWVVNTKLSSLHSSCNVYLCLKRLSVTIIIIKLIKIFWYLQKSSALKFWLKAFPGLHFWVLVMAEAYCFSESEMSLNPSPQISMAKLNVAAFFFLYDKWRWLIGRWQL